MIQQIISHKSRQFLICELAVKDEELQIGTWH